MRLLVGCKVSVSWTTDCLGISVDADDSDAPLGGTDEDESEGMDEGFEVADDLDEIDGKFRRL